MYVFPSGGRILSVRQPPTLTPSQLFNYAQKKGFAIPAINVTSS
jgi:hypothetical protein